MNKPALNHWLGKMGFDQTDPTQSIEHIDSTRRYKFQAYLLNQDARAIGIRRGAIDELVIVDDILKWYHRGIMTFSNPDDIIERSTTIHEEKNTDGVVNIIDPYIVYEKNKYGIGGSCNDGFSYYASSIKKEF